MRIVGILRVIVTAPVIGVLMMLALIGPWVALRAMTDWVEGVIWAVCGSVLALCLTVVVSGAAVRNAAPAVEVGPGRDNVVDNVLRALQAQTGRGFRAQAVVVPGQAPRPLVISTLTGPFVILGSNVGRRPEDIDAQVRQVRRARYLGTSVVGVWVIYLDMWLATWLRAIRVILAPRPSHNTAKTTILVRSLLAIVVVPWCATQALFAWVGCAVGHLLVGRTTWHTATSLLRRGDDDPALLSRVGLPVGKGLGILVACGLTFVMVWGTAVLSRIPVHLMPLQGEAEVTCEINNMFPMANGLGTSTRYAHQCQLSGTAAQALEDAGLQPTEVRRAMGRTYTLGHSAATPVRGTVVDVAIRVYRVSPAVVGVRWFGHDPFFVRIAGGALSVMVTSAGLWVVMALFARGRPRRPVRRPGSDHRLHMEHWPGKQREISPLPAREWAEGADDLLLRPPRSR